MHWRPFARSAGSTLAVLIAACSPTQDKFIAANPAERTDTWALQRADLECRDELRSEKWAYRLQLRYRVANDPDYVSCMERKGFVRTQKLPASCEKSPIVCASGRPPADQSRWGPSGESLAYSALVLRPIPPQEGELCAGTPGGEPRKLVLAIHCLLATSWDQGTTISPSPV